MADDVSTEAFEQDMQAILDVAGAMPDTSARELLQELVACARQQFALASVIERHTQTAEAELAKATPDSNALQGSKRELQSAVQQLSVLESQTLPSLLRKLQEVSTDPASEQLLAKVNASLGVRASDIPIEAEPENNGDGGASMWDD